MMLARYLISMNSTIDLAVLFQAEQPLPFRCGTQRIIRLEHYLYTAGCTAEG